MQTGRNDGQHSFALLLALWYVALVVYASLYPFHSWRDQGVPPWDYLWAPWPRYWTLKDVLANLAGYVPLGFLITWAAWRRGARLWALLAGALLPALLSLGLEAAQSYLPQRVPSNVDWLLNAAGATGGAVLAMALGRLGAIARWSDFRQRVFVQDSRGAMVLLALWPPALLYPSSLPFGLGQAWQRAEVWLAETLVDTPFAAWLPAEPPALNELSALGVAVCVAFSLLAPCLLGYAVLATLRQRIWYWAFFCAGAFGVGGVSAGLTYGTAHAWAWLAPPVVAGGMAAGVLALLCLGLPRRTCAVLMLLALAFSLGLLNQAPDSPYLDQSLQVWEQSRYSHFHGLSQWLGWLWPYLALAYGVALASRRERPH
jgi:VanZ family protein